MTSFVVARCIVESCNPESCNPESVMKSLHLTLFLGSYRIHTSSSDPLYLPLAKGENRNLQRRNSYFPPLQGGTKGGKPEIVQRTKMCVHRSPSLGKGLG
jgi:hypothetical protein